jgi:hypothetical protein
MDRGPVTGWGMGFCRWPYPGCSRPSWIPRFGMGMRRAWGGGFGHWFGRVGAVPAMTRELRRDWLQQHKRWLEEQLKYIDEQLKEE